MILLIVAGAMGCTQEVSTPKPYAYHRIELQAKNYQGISEDLPYHFEIANVAELNWPKPSEQPYWVNIDYPELQATIYLSYLKIDGPETLGKYIDESQRMTFKHTVKASSIEEMLIAKKDQRVFGLFYKVGGNAASNSQFYLTDSVNHFVRGAMYFNTPPRADSLAPVVEYVMEDIGQLLKTFSWK